MESEKPKYLEHGICKFIIILFLGEFFSLEYYDNQIKYH